MDTMSESGHDVERLRHELRRLTETKGDGAECYRVETLWESATGRLARAENRAVVLHIAECASCATAWELARELGPAGEAAGRAPAPTRRRWIPAVAAAVLLATVAAWLWKPMEVHEPAYRDTSGDWIVSELEVGRLLERTDCTLRWSAGPEGTTYDVRVTTADLTPIAQGLDLAEPSFRVDPSSLASDPVEGDRAAARRGQDRLEHLPYAGGMSDGPIEPCGVRAVGGVDWLPGRHVGPCRVGRPDARRLRQCGDPCPARSGVLPLLPASGEGAWHD